MLWQGKYYVTESLVEPHSSLQPLSACDSCCSSLLSTFCCLPLYWDCVNIYWHIFNTNACFKLKSNWVKTRDLDHYSAGTDTLCQLLTYQNSKCQTHQQLLLWSALKFFLSIKTRLEEKDTQVFIWFCRVWFCLKPVPNTMLDTLKSIWLLS